MRTTINIDDELLAKAAKLVGPLDRSAVVHEGLKALIERESARRLARLGSTQPAIGKSEISTRSSPCSLMFSVCSATVSISCGALATAPLHNVLSIAINPPFRKSCKQRS